MKTRIAAVILSILLVAAGTGTFTAQEVKAAPNMSVILNGQALSLTDSTVYKSGGAVMVPLREVAEALKYKITYQGSTGKVQLSRVNEIIEFQVGGHEIVIGEKDKKKVSFKGAIETKDKRLYVPLSFLNSMGLIAGYSTGTNQLEIYTPEVAAGAVSMLLATGQYQELQTRYFNDKSGQMPDLPLIQKNWEQIAVPAGKYFGVKSTASDWGEDTLTIQSILYFTEAEAVLTLSLDSVGKITGLKLEPVAAADESHS
ncbi:stalk domain-containing protein [Paenibacillus tianjinensis]|uniref:Copper amine oxidase N-terminal domain-containing protein n=1 Tax=Paenibacillus tianjinensis TaxID=2810347 RepID=A0ABX7LGM5_9BACL|nr:stalk domain-containing protein [Paenibacillus tianjinensis]QSF47262.1 copper amine oxidase N-terminal domain-containing protein [Paenibacillus tianjinensis]